MAKGPKFYAVRVGRRPGIYCTWPECETEVKGFSYAKFQSFTSRSDAEAYMGGAQTALAPVVSIGAQARSSASTAGHGSSSVVLEGPSSSTIDQSDAFVSDRETPASPCGKRRRESIGEFAQIASGHEDDTSASTAEIDCGEECVMGSHALLGGLCNEQRAVVDAVRKGGNIFLTGSAGVGKSVTLRAIINVLRAMYGSDRVAVCASTGIAAEPLGGSTLHNFAACRKGEYYRDFLAMAKDDHRRRIVQCAALVIDGEIRTSSWRGFTSHARYMHNAFKLCYRNFNDLWRVFRCFVRYYIVYSG